MIHHRGFRLPRLLLPRPGIDLRIWAVLACDQYTSEPAYWERVAREVGDAPSTLHLILPETFLGADDTAARVVRIQQTMRRYLDQAIFAAHEGAVLVERSVGGRTRRGLMLELDLEHYDFAADSTSLIRPTEGTLVERLAPRIAVRRGAELELPHILVLIDDPACTVIEPVAAARASLQRLYEGELMLGGGHLAGFAVDAAAGESAAAALGALAGARVFETRYGVSPGTPPMLFAVGDGNHSLATAKSIWQQLRPGVGPDHPARWALVEVVNIHDPALHFAPIHRLLFGVRGDLRRALAETFGARLSIADMPSAAAMRESVRGAGPARHAAGLVEPGGRFSVVEVADPGSPLAVATFQGFVDAFVAGGGAAQVDYVHGDDALERLAATEGRAGLHLAAIDKSELMRRVVLDGPLPRKAFSMGEADEKRFYVEARRIRSPGH